MELHCSIQQNTFLFQDICAMKAMNSLEMTEQYARQQDGVHPLQFAKVCASLIVGTQQIRCFQKHAHA